MGTRSLCLDTCLGEGFVERTLPQTRSMFGYDRSGTVRMEGPGLLLRPLWGGRCRFCLCRALGCCRGVPRPVGRDVLGIETQASHWTHQLATDVRTWLLTNLEYILNDLRSAYNIVPDSEKHTHCSVTLCLKLTLTGHF